MTVFLILLAACALLLLAGILYQVIGTARDSRRYPPPGRMLDAGGHRLHIHCQGEGGPAVILEAGIAASSVSWNLVQSRTALFTTVCSYDRAGLGWSDASRTPPSLDSLLADLHALLAAAQIHTPFVLAGHSFGGLVALEYALAHPADLAGLVLVDPLPAAKWHPLSTTGAAMLRRGIALSRRGAWVARLGVVRVSLDLLRAGSRRIPKLAARASSGSGSQLTERLVGEVRKLPRELWPLIQSHWCRPKCFLALAAHLRALPAIASACRSQSDLGGLPLIVLSAVNSTVDRTAAHQAMAARSTRGEFISATHSGHWIQLDQPDLVVSAIRKIVEAAR